MSQWKQIKKELKFESYDYGLNITLKFMETTLNTNEKRLHFLAKHKIDSNSKSEK